jgi:Protein NO VEIN, C-terminal
MQTALKYFEDNDYLVEDVSATNPYDVLAIDANSELHVEVKGSSGISTTVELTAGEVSEATSRPDGSLLLFVVDGIVWRRLPSGEVETRGGRMRLWRAWRPEAERLTPTSFRYLLPPAEDEQR